MHYTSFPYVVSRKLLDARIIPPLFILFAILFIEHYLGLQSASISVPFFSLSASTPFILTWNGKKFVFENDFLFGKPSSLFSNKDEGMRAYESGAITPDLYKIQNSVQLKDGHFVAQIKEIEPEESYIDHLSLFRVTYPQNTELIVDSKFRDFHIFEKGALEKLEGVRKRSVLLNGNAVTNIAGDTKKIWQDMGDKDGYMLEPQKDSLEVKGVVKDKSRPVYLLLRAHIRDWTVGEIFDASKKEHQIPAEKLFSTLPQTSVKRTPVTIAGFVRGMATATNSLLRYVSGEMRKTKTIASFPKAMQYTNAYLPLPPW